LLAGQVTALGEKNKTAEALSQFSLRRRQITSFALGIKTIAAMRAITKRLVFSHAAPAE
jgi:hypothetical protein